MRSAEDGPQQTTHQSDGDDDDANSDDDDAGDEDDGSGRDSSSDGLETGRDGVTAAVLLASGTDGVGLLEVVGSGEPMSIARTSMIMSSRIRTMLKALKEKREEKMRKKKKC